MTNLELENRLRNFETLTFVNDTDVFEFMFSRINGDLFRVMRNGSFSPTRLTILDIMSIIKIRNLQLEESGNCYHCEEPKNDINYSYCCKGCEDAEIKFNEMEN